MTRSVLLLLIGCTSSPQTTPSSSTGQDEVAYGGWYCSSWTVEGHAYGDVTQESCWQAAEANANDQCIAETGVDCCSFTFRHYCGNNHPYDNCCVNGHKQVWLLDVGESCSGGWECFSGTCTCGQCQSSCQPPQNSCWSDCECCSGSCDQGNHWCN